MNSPPPDFTNPKTFWEDRCDSMEGCLERVMRVLVKHLPSALPEIKAINDEWNAIREETEKDWNPANQTNIDTNDQ